VGRALKGRFLMKDGKQVEFEDEIKVRAILR
jgi:hypothetical protein